MSDVESSELEVLETEVYDFLPSMTSSELEQLYESIGLSCPEIFKGKRNMLMRGINKHLLEVETTGNKDTVIKSIHSFCVEKSGKVDMTETPGEENKIGLLDSNTVENILNGPLMDIPVMKTKFEEFLKQCTDNWEEVKQQKLIAQKKEAEERMKKVVQNIPTAAVARPAVLKLSGTIGGSKSISYEDLNFQIKIAVKQGYHEQQMVGAIIRAISSDAEDLRTLFELRADNLNLGDMLAVLEPILKEKDSASYFSELCNAIQNSTQTCMEFVVGLLSLKEKILVRSLKEGTPFDKNMLMNQLMKTLYSGIRNTNIRSEIRENCRGIQDITEAQLVKIVGEAVSIENTRNEKFAARKSEINALNLGNVENFKPGKNKENYLPVQVQELKVAHETQMAGLKADMDELKSLFTSTVNNLVAQATAQNNSPNNNNMLRHNAQTWYPSNNIPEIAPPHQAQNLLRQDPHLGNNGRNWRRRGRCDACVSGNVFRCPHCFVCNGEGHKSTECPTRNANGNPGNEIRS